MAFISLLEVLDIFIMTLAVGFIFKDAFQARRDPDDYDPLVHGVGFDWHGFWESCIVTAPAIILHEMGHKFVGMAFGLDAVFHASYTGLLLGVALKLFGSPIIFFVPAFVSISGGNLVTMAATSFAGPAVNGLIWIIAYLVLRDKKSMKVSTYHRWVLTKRISGFLFVFNMIPIPGFDGYTFFSSLFHILFG